MLEDQMKGRRSLVTDMYQDQRIYSQFNQRVKRGEGICVDPLDHIPAQITDRKDSKLKCTQRNWNDTLNVVCLLPLDVSNGS